MTDESDQTLSRSDVETRFDAVTTGLKGRLHARAIKLELN